MDERLNEKEIRQIAQGAGIGEKAVIRLLGSQKIPINPPDAGTEEDELGDYKLVDIGLRLGNPEALLRLLTAMSREELIEELKVCFKEYAGACPLVVAWVGRGDFNPRKLPDRVNNTHIRHATASAGRIRSRLLRRGRDPIYH